MRIFWAGFLMTGLVLIGLDAYDRRQTGDDPLARDGIVTYSAEDGSPMPHPYPTPSPKTR